MNRDTSQQNNRLLQYHLKPDEATLSGNIQHWMIITPSALKAYSYRPTVHVY